MIPPVRKISSAALLPLLALCSALAMAAPSLSAQVFNGGLPAGYTCVGQCGTSGANGSIPLAPNGGSQFGYVTTAGSGATPNPLNISGTTNGSQLTSSLFTATAGQKLSFGFNYITSDGTANFTDYAYARLIGSGGASNVTLFTARTTPGGNTVPGFGLPPIASGVTLNPSTVTIKPGTLFGPLGASSGDCYQGVGNGCGNTGWVFASFLFPDAGTYQLQVGVNNLVDQNFDSALAVDFDAGAGGVPTVPIGPSTVPEPSSLALLGTGLVGLVPMLRRKVKK
ncbi:MAG: NF038132 family protein [Gemmatimonadaceae bacterium]